MVDSSSGEGKKLKDAPASFKSNVLIHFGFSSVRFENIFVNAFVFSV